MPKIEDPAAATESFPADATDIRVETVSTIDAAANAIRELILDGRLEPGARLREAEFAERLGIARHSFRAATQVLISEGLLRREPNRGVAVPVFEPDDLIDVFRLRTALETEAVRIVIAEGRVPEGADAAVQEMSQLPEDAPWHAVVDPDRRFHEAIIQAAGSERLSRAYATVGSEILLCLVRLRPHYERPSDVCAEHEELLAAIQGARADEAERLLRIHLEEAAENLTRAWQEMSGERVVV
jgi:DNA-binding GntR family transcriptional regulator